MDAFSQNEIDDNRCLLMHFSPLYFKNPLMSHSNLNVSHSYNA